MRLTLEKYQQLEAVNNDKTLDDFDKSLFSICALYGLTEEQLDNYRPKKVIRMANRVNRLFSKPLNLDAPGRINLFKINYEIEKITLGQYVDLVYYTKANDVVNTAQYIVATMARGFKEISLNYKVNHFIKCEADIIIGAAIKIKSNFEIFNSTKFKKLFEPYPEMPEDNSRLAKWFSDNYGWPFSVNSVADFEKITQEQAYNLPVIRGLNDLMFLKAKGRFDYYLATKDK